jgi:hypothetical protein
MPPRESGSRQRILQQSKPTVVRSLDAALSPDKTTRAAVAAGRRRRNNSRDHAGERANQNVPMIRGVRIATGSSGAVITWQYRSRPSIRPARPRGDGAAPPFAAGGSEQKGKMKKRTTMTRQSHMSARVGGPWAVGRGPCETLEAHESRGA